VSRLIKAFALLAALVAAVAVATGCGGGNNNKTSSATTNTTTTTPAGGGGGSKIKISADPSGALKFDKSSLSAKAGKVTITMDNPSPVQHSVGIKGNGLDEKGNTVSKGGVSTVSASLKPGTYEFYCPVDGHEQAGMKGTLTVK
jgi:uncharacterized cupredoxin-like copper-binding protein